LDERLKLRQSFLFTIVESLIEHYPSYPLKSYTPKIPNTRIKRRSIKVTLNNSGNDLNIELTTILKLLF
jgi:hypothetical protein